MKKRKTAISNPNIKPPRRKVVSFNHIEVTKDIEETLEEYYKTIHKKYWMAKACRKKMKRLNVILNIVSGAMVAAGAGTVIVFPPWAIFIFLIGAISLKKLIDMKGWGKKGDLSQQAEIAFKSILDDIQAYMRGVGDFNNKEFAMRLQEKEKLLDGICPDTSSFQKSYHKKFDLNK